MRITSQAQNVRATLTDILDAALPASSARQSAFAAAGFDAELWKRLAQGFGISAMHGPESLGGSGDQSLVAVACEVLGERLSNLPYLPTVVLGSMPLLSAHRTDAGEAVLAALLHGDVTATSALDVSVHISGDAVTGHASRVFHGALSDWILLPDDDRVLGVRCEDITHVVPVRSIDLTRPLADLHLQGTPCVLLGQREPGWQTHTRRDLLTYLAHECAAGARQATRMAVEYAKLRRQFGRQIGSYQAVKHLCAEMTIDAEAASASALAASSGRGGGQYATASIAAYLCAVEAFIRCARESLHVHGGNGFTWESDLHLYYRRAYANAALLGRISELKQEYGRLLLAGAAEATVVR